MTEKDSNSIQLLQGTLTLFESDWPDLLNTDCNPLDIALPLIDENGLLSYRDFNNLKRQFTQQLQRAVNANYMAFNDSIGSYGISIETLNQSQDRLSNIRDCLGSVNSMLNSQSNILGELNTKRMEYGQILNILEEINDVQKKLTILQESVENREFEKSVELVREIQEISSDNRLSSIDGLQSLHLRIDSLVSLLLDGLIDEIGNYIYLKNSSNINSENSTTSNRIPVNKGLLGFIKKLNGKTVCEDEELEIQKGKYDELLERFKLVQKLNKENECLSSLIDNCDREIKQIIKRSVSEVKNRFPTQIEVNSSGLGDKKNPFASFNLLQGLNGVIIKEVFESIFSKILYLLQRHLVIYEIAKISGYKYKISRVLKEIQKQISLIIFNYVIDENLLNDLEELDLKSKNKTSNSPFDKVPKQFEGIENGPMFQFSKLTLSSLSGDLINSLNNIFVSQGQGIISSEFNFQNKMDNSIFIGVDDVNESKKNILVPPNIFNMAYIIDEFINLTNNLLTIYPSADSSKTSTSGVLIFFNQFMDVVFISQLENSLMYQFDKLCESKWKPDQLLDASLSFEQFFNKVMILLDTTLYYRPSYVQIIFNLLHRIIDKYKEIQEILLKTNESKLLNKWINDSKLKMISNDIVKNLLNSNRTTAMSEILDSLQSKELTYALSIGGSYIPTMDPNSFLTLERMKSLVDLLASLSNMLRWLPKMKRKAPELFQGIDLKQKLKQTWSLSIFNDSEFPLSIVNLDDDSNKSFKINNVDDNDRNNNGIYLANDIETDIQGFISLDTKSGQEFDELVSTLNALMNDVEILIRYEIRVECIWCMIQMMVKKQWEQNGDESVDLGVDKFCEKVNNISRIFTRISKNIINRSKDEIRIRIFGGLGFWIDKLIIFESRRIEVMGKSGWMKMIVNLRVLQQVVKNIDSDIESDFELGGGVINGSLKYFTLGMSGEKFIMSIDKVRNEGINLSEEDWKNLIRLVYSEKMRKEGGSNINKKYMAAQARLLKSLAVNMNKS